MPHIKQWFAAAICLFLLGCKTTPPPIPTSNIVPISSPTAEPTAIPSVTKPPLATATLVPATTTLVTATKVVAAATPTQPEEIALTGGTIPLTATPVPELLDRRPSLEAIQDYLSRTTIRYFPSGPGELDNNYRYFKDMPLTSYTELLYQDVNGDGEEDLIISDATTSWWSHSILAVMLWTKTGYTTPIMLVNIGKYDVGMLIRFEDWTGDDVTEIIFDTYSSFGGTGTTIVVHTRTVIHCDITCEPVWEYLISEMIVNPSASGQISWERAGVEHTINEVVPIINVTWQGFISPSIHPRDESIQVYTTTLSTFTWDGTTFVNSGETILAPAYTVTSDQNLMTTNSSGNIAAISSTDSGWDNGFRLYECQLVISDQIIGEPFVCTPKFTAVIWQDLNGDRSDEVIVKTIANALQHVQVFTWDGIVAIQIADIEAPIVQPDLLGVRIEDLNTDGIMELIANDSYLKALECRPAFYQASLDYHDDPPMVGESCYHEWVFSEQVYRWNGEIYVLIEEG